MSVFLFDNQNYYCNEPSCYYNSALIVTIAYSAVCKNSPEEILPTNQTLLDVEGMTSANGLNGGKKPTETTVEATASESLEATEPENENKGCRSSVSSVAVLSAALLPLLCTLVANSNTRKNKF